VIVKVQHHNQISTLYVTCFINHQFTNIVYRFKSVDNVRDLMNSYRLLVAVY